MSTFTYTGELYIETCCHDGCAVTFGLDIGHYRLLHRSHDWFYCPNGHAQHYTGKSDEEKLREAEARENALRDQLQAATREREIAQQTILRERARFANGVCPCCNRSFQNVRRHMESEHPDYKTSNLTKPPRYQCGCGMRFETWHGLRTHQGRVRPYDWARPGRSRYSSHLTVVG